MTPPPRRPPRPSAGIPAHAARRGSRWPGARRAARRRRRLALVGTVVVLGLVAWLVASSGSPAPRQPSRTASDARRAPSGSGTQLAVSMARWHLPAPLSRAGAVPLADGRVLLVGGLLGSGSSSADVGVLDTATGRLTSVSSLVSPTHDAGITAVGGRVLVFGGGQSTPTATVQALPVPAGPTPSGGAVVTGQLPQVRADDEAVTIGQTAYVVGGYDGAVGDAPVLATRDGATFTTVATLPVAVRYPAVTALGGSIYVFGGESERGGTTAQYSTPAGSTTPPPGQQVAVAQEINPRTHGARVVGYLPHAVQGAAAFVLGGTIFLAGGDSNAPGTPPSSGTTIWSFDPKSGAFRVAGHLAAPVAYAAVAVSKGTVWLVGGERDGVAVTSAQRIVLRAARRT